METLAERIAREGGLAEIDAVGWVIRITRSIERIHKRGAIHGRISADAVVVESDKCTTVGRLIPLAEIPENVAYHSPERERGEGGSHADDTWAVAVTLYFLLSGSLPFSGANDAEVRRKIASVPAPPLAVFDVGDDALQAIVDRALARTRAARTASLAELRAELEGWRPAVGLEALPPLVGDDEFDDEVTIVQPELIRRVLAAAAIPARAPRRGAPPAPPPLPAKPRVLIQLPGLVDEASSDDNSSDPFAIPPSRASVPRILGLREALSDETPSAPPPASQPPSAAPLTMGPTADTTEDSPAPARGSRFGVVAACFIALIAGGVAAFLWSRARALHHAPPFAAPVATASAPPAPGDAAPTGSTGPVTPDTGASSSSTASAPPTASAAPAAATSARATAADVTACVVPLFPPDSFDAAADLSFACGETDPLKGGAALRSQLVRAHHTVSEGMKEWAMLGWYEMAAFSVVRARCCPSAPPLHLPEAGVCVPVPDTLGGITAAVASTTDPSDKGLKKAVDAYTTDVHCIVRSGVAGRFGRVGNPQGGEDTAFMRFLARVVKEKR